MRASVRARSEDAADRLQPTVTSSAKQTIPAEVIVVDDGSSDPGMPS
jgi:glycosyltransferase involved in cell wall biosynthesis